MKAVKTEQELYRLGKLMNTTDYKGYDDLKKAIILHEAFQVRPFRVEQLTGVNNDRLKRAIEAERKGRELGRIGGVKKFSEEIEAEIVLRLHEAMENRQDLSYNVVKTMVLHKLQSNSNLFDSSISDLVSKCLDDP
jgi:homoserine dehydrogenase